MNTVVDRVAIVPARGGSKRIPRKNIRPFLGVPLIQRTIDTLLSAELFARVIVSTDDEEIAHVSEAAGAEVPFRRPDHLADDHTPTVPVILHALDWLASNGEPTAEVAVVYPAAVFMAPEDLLAAHASLEERQVDQVFSACHFEAPIQRAWRLNSNGLVEMLNPEHANTRSQDLEPAFYDAGQFYWWAAGTADKLRRAEPVTRAMHLMPPWRVQDIDTPEDWEMAERLFQMQHSSE